MGQAPGLFERPGALLYSRTWRNHTDERAHTMPFKASEKVEKLDYDFEEFGPKGTIPEPSSKQVEEYQRAITQALKNTGMDPESIATGKIKMDQIDDLLQTVHGLEQEMVAATADITGIAHSVLNALPYRHKAAFMGWIMGEFFNPQH